MDGLSFIQVLLTSSMISVVVSVGSTNVLASYIRGAERRNLDRNARVEELCNTINNLSEMSARYWRTDYYNDIAELEDNIITTQHVMMTQINYLSSYDSKFEQGTKDLIFSLQDVATGGEFKKAKRDKDSQRAQLCKISAANLIQSIREINRFFLQRRFQ